MTDFEQLEKEHPLILQAGVRPFEKNLLNFKK